MKICKCGETNLEKFYKDKYKKDGLCFLCIKCMKEKQKTYKPSKEAVERKRIRQNSKTGYSWREKWRKSEKGLAWLKKRRLSNCITAGMHRSLKTNKNGFHWEDLVDYTLEDLKQHLEKQFSHGMTWDNHNKKGWHIDHIKPIYTFNITSYKCNEFKKCWNLGNLRPLWSYENQKRKRK